jgi:hypothetical protein
MCKPGTAAREFVAMQNKNVVKFREINDFVLRHRQRNRFILWSWMVPRLNQTKIARRSRMAAIAEILSTVATRPDPRGCDLPTCPVCADTMVAAEASAYLNDSVISYLWTCDTCGYGFVTKHSVKRFACN